MKKGVSKVVMAVIIALFLTTNMALPVKLYAKPPNGGGLGFQELELTPYMERCPLQNNMFPWGSDFPDVRPKNSLRIVGDLLSKNDIWDAYVCSNPLTWKLFIRIFQLLLGF